MRSAFFETHWRAIRWIAPTLAAVASIGLAACKDNQVGGNQACTSGCFQLNGVPSDKAEAEAKKACMAMGRKGKPEITERTETSLAGRCPE